MAKMYNLVQIVRINGYVTNTINLGCGDAESTRKKAAHAVSQLESYYTVREKGNRIIATGYIENQSIKVFIEAREMNVDKKYCVKKIVLKNGSHQDEIVFEGSKEDCSIFAHKEVERYRGLDEFEYRFTYNGNAHISFTTKKGTRMKVVYFIKVAA